MNYDVCGNYNSQHIEHFYPIKQKISMNGRCGNQGDYTTCPNNKCCSDEGIFNRYINSGFITIGCTYITIGDANATL